MARPVQVTPSLLCSRLSAAEQDLHTSQGGADDLRSEFAKRIGTMEKKLQAVNKVHANW